MLGDVKRRVGDSSDDTLLALEDVCAEVLAKVADGDRGGLRRGRHVLVALCAARVMCVIEPAFPKCPRDGPYEDRDLCIRISMSVI